MPSEYNIRTKLQCLVDDYSLIGSHEYSFCTSFSNHVGLSLSKTIKTIENQICKQRIFKLTSLPIVKATCNPIGRILFKLCHFIPQLASNLCMYTDIKKTGLGCLFIMITENCGK